MFWRTTLTNSIHQTSFNTIDLINKWIFLLPLSRLFFPYQSANETHRFQAIQGHKDGLEASAVVLLQTCLGLAAALGCAAWGVVTARPSAQCLVSRQYLCQAALLGVGQYRTRYVVVARILEPRCRVAKRVEAGRRRKRNVSRSLVSVRRISSWICTAFLMKMKGILAECIPRMYRLR